MGTKTVLFCDVCKSEVETLEGHVVSDETLEVCGPCRNLLMRASNDAYTKFRSELSPILADQITVIRLMQSLRDLHAEEFMRAFGTWGEGLLIKAAGGKS